MANDTTGKEIAWIVMANADEHVRGLLSSLDKTGTVRSGDTMYVKYGYSSMGKAYQDGQDEAAGDGYSRFVYIHQDVRFIEDVREQLDGYLGSCHDY